MESFDARGTLTRAEVTRMKCLINSHKSQILRNGMSSGQPFELLSHRVDFRSRARASPGGFWRRQAACHYHMLVIIMISDRIFFQPSPQSRENCIRNETSVPECGSTYVQKLFGLHACAHTASHPPCITACHISREQQ